MFPIQKPAAEAAAPSPLRLVTISAGEQDAASARLRRSAALGLALSLAALIAFAALQYRMPDGFASLFWGHNPLGAWDFGAHVLGRTPPHMENGPYRTCFRILLLAIWMGYALAIALGLQGGVLKPKYTLPLVIAVPLLLAVLCPPSLTTDVYAYAAYARMHVLYGQNPYTQTPAYLLAAGDPAARFLFWNLPSVYGPTWTWISVAAVAALHAAGLWWQVVAMKLIAAAALIGAALAGRKVAEHFSPGRGDLALLAIGLNPLLLIEGPSNGHNDMLLISLLLAAALFQLQKKYVLTGLFLGLSIGIKLITVAVLPWVVWECCRGRQGREKLRLALTMGALALLPAVLCYTPYWHGAATFTAIQMRSTFGTDAAMLARDIRLADWLAQHGLPGALVTALVSLSRQWPVVLAYAALSLWLWRRRAAGSWITAWVILAPCLIFFTMGVPFPWYQIWFWTLCLTRWDRFHLGLSAASFGLALTWECLYTCWRPV